jgi:hypothetical protein
MKTKTAWRINNRMRTTGVSRKSIWSGEKQPTVIYAKFVPLRRIMQIVIDIKAVGLFNASHRDDRPWNQYVIVKLIT